MELGRRTSALLSMVVLFIFTQPAWAVKDLLTDSECKAARQMAQATNPEQVWKQPIGRFEPLDSRTTENGFLASWAAVFNDGAFGLEMARWSDPGFAGDLEGQVLFAMACVDESPKNVKMTEKSDGTTRYFTGKALSGRVVQVTYMKMSPQNFAVQLLIGYPKK